METVLLNSCCSGTPDVQACMTQDAPNICVQAVPLPQLDLVLQYVFSCHWEVLIAVPAWRLCTLLAACSICRAKIHKSITVKGQWQKLDLFSECSVYHWEESPPQVQIN